MSIDNTPVDQLPDDLDSFTELLHGTKPATEPVEDNEEPEEVDATLEQEDTQTEDEDALATDAEEDDEPEEKPEPKLTPTQKRINQLLEKERLQKERADALEARLKKLEDTGVTPTPKVVVQEDKAPSPDDLNEDGTDKYPLGQFDPQFAEDHIKYRLDKEFEARKQEELQKAQEQEAAKANEAIVEAWQEKLEPAKERYPDFLERGDELVSTFADLDPTYGEYLTGTIMSMEYGPDVLYYLSTNIDEAQRIVKLGPTKAVLALGRLENRFAENVEVEDKPKPRRVSKAPAPPPTNKGSVAAIAEVPDDTDDLDAFAAKLFKKR